MLSENLRETDFIPNIRSSQSIAAEISLLSKLSTQVPHETAFGDSNLDAMKIQIEVLSRRLSMEQVDRWYERDEVQQYIWLCAKFASEWLYENTLAPSEDWMTMLYPEQVSRWLH